MCDKHFASFPLPVLPVFIFDLSQRLDSEEICLEAVKENGCALQYVDKNIFEVHYKEYTIKQIEEILGEKIKIMGGK